MLQGCQYPVSGLEYGTIRSIPSYVYAWSRLRQKIRIWTLKRSNIRSFFLQEVTECSVSGLDIGPNIRSMPIYIHAPGLDCGTRIRNLKGQISGHLKVSNKMCGFRPRTQPKYPVHPQLYTLGLDCGAKIKFWTLQIKYPVFLNSEAASIIHW